MPPETKLVRISKPAWRALRKVVADYDFNMGDLVEWILLNEDLDNYAESLNACVEFDEGDIEGSSLRELIESDEAKSESEDEEE